MAVALEANQHDAEMAAREFYLSALEILDRCAVRYTVGGGYAMAAHSGIVRHTKDLDVFIKADDLDRVLQAFKDAGFRTELTWPHFLAKALSGDAFADILYGSANGLCPVDDALFDFAVPGTVLGRQVLLCPVEEMIWSKAFVQSRDRFDGADVMHLIRSAGDRIDWRRLRERFRGHEAVLLSHLIVFGYVYPDASNVVPRAIVDELLSAARAQPVPGEKICRGTFLSNDQYRHDIEQEGYRDARLKPSGTLNQQEIDSLSR